MAYVFDGITVLNPDASTLATVGRPEGPIEEGYFDPNGNWIPEHQPAFIPSSNAFGIDGSGNAYFDTNGASLGEQAAFWVDPTTFEVWVER